jgi:hypothetical protein
MPVTNAATSGTINNLTANSLHHLRIYGTNEIFAGGLTTKVGSWDSTKPAYIMANCIATAAVPNFKQKADAIGASVTLQWDTFTDPCKSLTYNSITLWRVAGHAGSTPPALTACISDPTGTGCAAMKHVVANPTGAAQAAYTGDSYNTVGYAWYEMVVVNANPDVSKQVSIAGFVTITTSVGAPGQLKATCTVSVSDLKATLGWAAAPFAAAGIITYEFDQKKAGGEWAQITKDAANKALGNITGTSHEWTAPSGGEYFFRVRAKATAAVGPNMECNIVNNVAKGVILKASDEPATVTVWDPSSSGNKTAQRATW